MDEQLFSFSDTKGTTLRASDSTLEKYCQTIEGRPLYKVCCLTQSVILKNPGTCTWFFG